MGCSNQKAIDAIDPNAVQAIEQQQQILFPPNFKILAIKQMQYDIKIYKLTVSAKLFLTQTIIASLQQNQRQIQIIATVISSNPQQIEFYVYYPQFDFNNFLITQIEQFDSKLQISKSNVCFIGHGPGTSVLKMLSNQYSIKQNYYIFSSQNKNFFDTLEDAIYCDISLNRHPIYELMKIKQCICQVVVCGPAWLLKLVRTFCLKHEIQGFGLLVLYCQYQKDYPVKWIDLNSDIITDELKDFDKIERIYAENHFQQLNQRIQYAKTYQQLTRDQPENIFSDSQQNRDTPYFDGSQNVLSEENSEAIALKSLKKMESDWLVTSIQRGVTKLPGGIKAPVDDVKKPNSTSTVRQESRSRSEMMLKREISQADKVSKKKVHSAVEAPAGQPRPHAKSEAEPMSNSANNIQRSQSRKKSGYTLPKRQSSFVERESSSTSLASNSDYDKPQVEIQPDHQEERANKHTADELNGKIQDVSIIEAQQKRVGSAEKKEALQQQEQRARKSQKKSRESIRTQNSSNLQPQSDEEQQNISTIQAKEQARKQAAEQTRKQAAEQCLDQKKDKLAGKSPGNSNSLATGEMPAKLKESAIASLVAAKSGIAPIDISDPRPNSQKTSKSKLPVLQTAVLPGKTLNDSDLQLPLLPKPQFATGEARSKTALEQAPPMAYLAEPTDASDQVVRIQPEQQPEPSTQNVQRQINQILLLQGATRPPNDGSRGRTPPNDESREQTPQLIDRQNSGANLLSTIPESQLLASVQQYAVQPQSSPYLKDSVINNSVESIRAAAAPDIPSQLQLKAADGLKTHAQDNFNITNDMLPSARNRMQSSMLMVPDTADSMRISVKLREPAEKQADLSIIQKKE